MNLREMSEKVERVSTGYVSKFGIDRNNDWYMLKLQEELGELTKAYCSVSGKGRSRRKTMDELKEDLSGEFADVFAHLLLFADKNNIDIENSLEKKWFKYLK